MDAYQAKLKARILAAFAEVPYPGDDNIVHPSWSPAYLAELIGMHWREVPPEDIIYHCDALNVLTPEAFRFYLPAYMIVTMEHFHDAGNLLDHVPGFFIPSALTRRDPVPANWRESRSLFTAEQRAAIAEFLRWAHSRTLLSDDELKSALSMVEKEA